MKHTKFTVAALAIILSAAMANAEITLDMPRHRDTVSSAKYYLLGITQAGNSVKVDGEEMKVYKTGTFGKEYMLQSGDNSIVIEISDGKETVSKSVNVFFDNQRKFPERNYTLGQAERILEKGRFKERSFYVETLPGAYLQYGDGNDRLGGSKMGYINEGITLKIVGEIHDLYKVQLSSGRFAYIEKDYTRPTAKMSQTVNTNSISIYNGGKYDRISISLPMRLPFSTWTQLDPTIINVDIFGAMNNSNWITHMRDLGMIEYAHVEQPESDVFRVVIKLKEKYAWGYSVKYNGNSLVIDVKHSPENIALKGMVIGLDAGHGGAASGAVSITGLKESEINLKIVYEIKKLLESKGAQVVLSREDDSNLNMTTRKKTFLENNIDLMVSVHNNAGGSPLKAMGTSTYYKHIVNRELASCLLDRMLELGVPNYGLVGNFNFSLNAPIEYPNALVECLFMSSLPDEEMLADPKTPEIIARKVVAGLEDYLKKVKKAKQGK